MLTVATIAWLSVGALALLAALLFLFGGFFTVEQQTVRIVQRFGAFSRVAGAGFHFKWPIINSVSDAVSLRVLQLDLKEITKTKNDVFVTIYPSVFYRLDPARIQDAFYKLEDPEAQIKIHVASAIRAQVPKMSLADVFENQHSIATEVKRELEATMTEYGYIIDSVLVPNVEPDAKVVAAMNEKMASEQAKVTAENLAAAAYTAKVEAAKSEARAMELHGEGIAKQREAIATGLQHSVEKFSAVEGVNAEAAMRLVGLTQYMDMLRDLARGGSTKVVFIDNSPSGMTNMEEGLRKALMVGAEASTPAPAAVSSS